MNQKPSDSQPSGQEEPASESRNSREPASSSRLANQSPSLQSEIHSSSSQPIIHPSSSGLRTTTCSTSGTSGNTSAASDNNSAAAANTSTASDNNSATSGTHELLSRYKRHIRKKQYFIGGVLIGILVAAMHGLISGAAGISASEVWRALTGHSESAIEQIIWNIRLPRILAALLAGLALSVSGAVMQSILRNPLASPFTLGISGAAAFGASFAIVMLGAGGVAGDAGTLNALTGRYLVMISAFCWSMISTFFILAMARYRGVTPEIMVLSGIAVGSLFNAGVSAMQYLATDVELSAIVFWMFGDLGRASWNEVFILAVLILPLLLFFLLMSWRFKSLQAGDEYARSLGIHPFRVRLAGMLAASLATALVVSFFGIIAFVGLVVPHIVRRLTGSDETFLIPAAALFGAMFLLLSDTFARTLFSPVILPVGILTSFIGAPLFLFLLLRGLGKNYWS